MSNTGKNHNIPSPLSSRTPSVTTTLPSFISTCPVGFEDISFENLILEDLLQRTFCAVEGKESFGQEPLRVEEPLSRLVKKGNEILVTVSGKSRLNLGSARAESAVLSEVSTVDSVEIAVSELYSSADVGLHDLPDQLLEAVLEYLPFAAVSRVGATSRRLRRAAACLLRKELRCLVPRMERMVGEVEALVRAQLAADGCLALVMARLLLHTLLRLLLGEARLLRALFWRYVRDDADDVVLKSPGGGGAEGSGVSGSGSGGSGAEAGVEGGAPQLCFPGGALLDEIERLLAQVAAADFSGDVEPEGASPLFMRTESFLDYFETELEPLLPCGETPFGLKVVDLLGACEAADCVLSVTHGEWERPFVVSMHFQLRDVSAVESPPFFDRQLSARTHLRQLFRYLRNNVRWSNFFRPMREIWDLQDELENRWNVRPGTGEARDISRHHVLHREVMEAVRQRIARGTLSPPPGPNFIGPPLSSSPFLPCPRFALDHTYEQVALQAEPATWRETFTRRADPSAWRLQRLGLCCDLQLSGANKGLLPLDLEFLDERRVRSALRNPRLTPDASLLIQSQELSPEPLQGLTPLLDTSAVPLKQPPTPPPEIGALSIDWGPWFRIRTAYPTPEVLPGTEQGGGGAEEWDDCGAALRDGGAYGFSGEVFVTFPPRALSSIVTETVIVLRDTVTDCSVTSDRRFV